MSRRRNRKLGPLFIENKASMKHIKRFETDLEQNMSLINENCPIPWVCYTLNTVDQYTLTLGANTAGNKTYNFYSWDTRGSNLGIYIPGYDGWLGDMHGYVNVATRRWLDPETIPFSLQNNLTNADSVISFGEDELGKSYVHYVQSSAGEYWEIYSTSDYSGDPEVVLTWYEITPVTSTMHSSKELSYYTPRHEIVA